MVERARAGRSVVRLKGGDPFVFGRGGEEAEALAAAGVAVRGGPRRHRRGRRAGLRRDPGHPPRRRLRRRLRHRPRGSRQGRARRSTGTRSRAFPGTLVIYMGVKRLPEIAERLIAAGRDAGEPAAAVERGTMAGQRTVTATLAELPAAVARRGSGPRDRSSSGRLRRGARRSPGSSAAPFTGGGSSSPGRGRRQAASRPRLRALGAEVIELPAIRIVPRIDSDGGRATRSPSIHSYALVCLTSPNGVAPAVRSDRRRRARRARPRQRDRRRDRPGHRGGAARARRDRRHRSRALDRRGARGGARPRRPVEGRPALVARAAEARDVLPEALARARRPGGRRRPVRDRRRGARPRGDRGGRRTPTTSPSRRPRPSGTSSERWRTRARRRPGWSRSAR